MKPSRDTGPQTVNYRPRTLSSKPKGQTMFDFIFKQASKMWGAGIGTAAGEALVRLIEGQVGDVFTATGEGFIIATVAMFVTWIFPANKQKPAA